MAITSLQLDNAYNSLKKVKDYFPEMKNTADNAITLITELNKLVYGPKGSIYECIYKNFQSLIHGGVVISISGMALARSEIGLLNLMEAVFQYCKEINTYIMKTEETMIIEERTYLFLMQNSPKPTKVFEPYIDNSETWNISTISIVSDKFAEITRSMNSLIEIIVKVRDEIKAIREQGIEIQEIDYSGISKLAEDGMIDTVSTIIEVLNSLIKIINDKVAGVETLNEKLSEQQLELMNAMNRVDYNKLQPGYNFRLKNDGTGLIGTVGTMTLGGESIYANCGNVETEFGNSIVNAVYNGSTYHQANRCQGWVQQVYDASGNTGGGGEGAYQAWKAFGVGTDSDWHNIPVGATVYATGWDKAGGNYSNQGDYSPTGNPWGHVGIHVGNGIIVDSRNGAMQTQTLDEWISIQEGKNTINGYSGYLGWGFNSKEAYEAWKAESGIN